METWLGPDVGELFVYPIGLALAKLFMLVRVLQCDGNQGKKQGGKVVWYCFLVGQRVVWQFL